MEKTNSLADLLVKFSTLKGAKFIGVNHYTNKYGEVSNQIINVNVSIENAKQSDLKALQSITDAELKVLATLNKISFDVAKKALTEMIVSAERNLSNNRTVASEAQSDAYLSIGKGLRIHKETKTVYVCGFANSKQVLVEGQYPSHNRQDKTVIKNAITEKYLKMANFRNFSLGSADALVITGDTIQLG